MFLAAGVIFGLAAVSGQGSEQASPGPIVPLHTLLSADDYPAEAIGRGEEGTAALRLIVDPEGKVTGCAVVSSSGSAALDSVSCRIMVERARFHPARNAQGKPIASDYTQRITWALEESRLPPRAHAASMLWTTCAVGEAAKLAFTELSPEAVAARAFKPCAELEAVLARELGLTVPLEEMRKSVTQMIERGLVQSRSAFEKEAER